MMDSGDKNRQGFKPTFGLKHGRLQVFVKNARWYAAEEMQYDTIQRAQVAGRVERYAVTCHAC